MIETFGINFNSDIKSTFGFYWKTFNRKNKHLICKCFPELRLKDEQKSIAILSRTLVCFFGVKLFVVEQFMQVYIWQLSGCRLDFVLNINQLCFIVLFLII